MNLYHRLMCSSGAWRETVETRVIPWVLQDIEVGANVLEVGPGPGVTTALLCKRVSRLTCVEISPQLAKSLAKRMRDTNVTVICEDATSMSFHDATFDGALSFTMLHHVPSADLQDRLLAEVARVLRPGGVFAGVDSIYRPSMRWMHLFDTMVLVEPATFPKRLENAGFVDVHVDVNPYAFRFRGLKP